ncbi:MAG: gliding motility protein GldM [Bacteroidales bacterium]|nr:gliding motility protein GldM [Bacteroidales bacterium]
MGATNCPETPRQKMIGMMYLFYTAMLALNVSKDILNAFAIVNNGLKQTNMNFSKKNEFVYQAFEISKQNDPLRVTPYYEAALKVKRYSKEMFDYIDSLKIDLISQVDAVSRDSAKKINEDILFFSRKDERDITHFYMLGESVDGSQGKARELKNKLIEFKKKLLDILKDPKINLPNKEQTIKSLGDLGINTENNPRPRPDYPDEKYWETERFSEIPAIGTITVLTQLQNQVKNAEATVIQTLLSAIGATDFKFDTVAPRVIPRSNYLISGDKYEAELFISAYSSTDTMSEVLIGDSYDSITKQLRGNIKKLKMQRGIAKYEVSGPGVGSHTYAAIIRVYNPSTGTYKEHPVKVGNKYSIEYTVAPPMAVVSPTKMNVLYIGVENPIEISVPGFRDDQIMASIQGGTIYRTGKGSWVAKVTTPGKTSINVSIKDDKGQVRSMGSKEFRVKRIPDPVPTVAGKKGGTIPKSLLLAQAGVQATLEGFDFDLKFNVVEFTVSANIGGFTKDASAKGSRFTPEQIALINQVQRGKKVYIENVRAQGPDGTIRSLGSIAFKLE